MKTAFLLVFIFPAFVFCQSPGGVGTNLALWNKANAGVTVSGSTVTGWADQKATNTFTITSTPQLDSANINYNPAIVMNGSSYFNGNTTITNITHVIAVGSIMNSAGNSNTGALVGNRNLANKYFFHTEGLPRRFTCSDGTNTTTVSPALPSNQINVSILSEDLGRTPAANDGIRQNGLTYGNSTGDPAPFSAIPALGSYPSSILPVNSVLAEAIIYTSSLSTSDLNKVESYLAIKYGITLSNSGGGTAGDYVSSAGALIWDASAGSSYHNNVIGIGRDDNSALTQKQSRQGDNTTRIYIGTLSNNNFTNASSFSSDAQFVIMGDNNATIANNTGNTEYPVASNIIGRINREWKIANTGFAGTFSLDITPSAGTYDANTLRLLIDDDGNFSNGGTTVYGTGISYAGGVITVANISTAMIPTDSTRYITLATVASPGAISPALTLWLKADAGINQSGGAISQWNDQSLNAVHVSQSTPAAQPTFTTDLINYYPVPAFDNTNDVLENSNIAYNRIMNVTGGSSNATTGSLFTVAKLKSLATDSRIVYQWNTVPAGSFIFQSYVDNTTGNLKVGGRGAAVVGSTNVLPDLNPFIATGLETTGTNNALHYYNGGNQKTTTTATNNASTSTNFLRVGSTMNGNVAEIIAYNVKLTDIQRRQIESYLAIKYGITLSTVGGGTFGDYISSGGATLWDASDNSTYHHQVIGLGRDDSTALLQKQSHTFDDTTRIYLSSLQNTNALNGGSFTADRSFVITGNNAGQMFTTGSTEYPTGQGIVSRLDREWKLTNIDYTGIFSMDFIPKYTNVTATDLRLLVDEDGDFTNATMLSGAGAPSISYNNGVITVSGIDNSMIPVNSTRYLTLVSLSSNTPLPVTLTAFTAAAKGSTVELKWATAAEQNNAYFAIERSANGSNWQQLATVPGAGNSSIPVNYSYTDEEPLNGISYYRLRQTDVDGTYKYSSTETVRLQIDAMELRLYPNPVKSEVIFKGNRFNIQRLRVFNQLGRDVTHQLQMRGDTDTTTVINMSALPDGFYIFRIGGTSYKVLKK